MLRIIVYQSGEEKGERRIKVEALTQRSDIGCRVSFHLEHLTLELQQEVAAGCVAQRQVQVFARLVHVLFLVSAIGSPVGSLRHVLVLLHIMIDGEQWLPMAVYVGVKEVEGPLVVLLVDEIGTAVEEVGTIGVEIFGMALSELQFHRSLFVGHGVH